MAVAHMAQPRQLADGDGLPVILVDVVDRGLDPPGRHPLPPGRRALAALRKPGKDFQKLGTHPQFVSRRPL